MKRFSILALLVLLPVLAVRAQEPAVIEVNGLANLFGSKLVMLKLDRGAENITLAEGQSRDGVRLLSVDAAAGLAKFDNRGKIQTVRISDAPDSAATASAAHSPQAISSASVRSRLADDNDSDSSALPSADNPGVLASVGGNSALIAGGGNSGGKNPANPGGNSGGSSSGGNGATGANDSSSTVGGEASGVDDSWKNSWRYRDAQMVEAARARDAAGIMAGEIQPYPLTPLTPPGTRAQLVSADELYFPPARKY